MKRFTRVNMAKYYVHNKYPYNHVKNFIKQVEYMDLEGINWYL
jgi:hypothetical protein